jgi:nicotinate-nucleotide--dimethylbenzimidazole phosphoribosyltransferase
MNTRPAPLVETPAENDAPATPSWPEVKPTANVQLDLMIRHHFTGAHDSDHAFGRMESLALQLACIQQTGHGLENLHFESPQLVVFAADHGIAVEGVSAFPQDTTAQRSLALLTGKTPVNALAQLHGFDITLVDAGVASHIQLPPDAVAAVPMLLRKIGYGTRNMVLAPAMSPAQARSAIEAGMDVVRHLPGNVVALSNIGVAATPVRRNCCPACAACRWPTPAARTRPSTRSGHSASSNDCSRRPAATARRPRRWTCSRPWAGSKLPCSVAP